MKQIIAAFGGHERATDTLRWAAELAHVTSTPLAVVNVFAPTSAEVEPNWYDELVGDRRALIDGVMDELAAAGTTVDAEVVVLKGHEPLDELARYVEDREDALVVIGTSDTHRPGGLGFGRPAHTLLHRVVQPVAMVPDDREPIAGGIVTVGVDGSGANAVAVEYAEQLAAATGSTLHAVFAYDPLDDTFTRPDHWHTHSDEVRRVVDKVSAAPHELFMAAGHPAQALIEHAERERAWAVVTGTRGRGGFDGLVLGRVPAQLIAHSRCPLIVVPH
jgi:nucleotide-binding universal stress UspA family protein